jgi:tripartite-type tricarboxylate transporter receptor subunit TctC
MSAAASMLSIASGKLRALRQISEKRGFNVIPTCVEQGLPFISANRYEVYAPAGTPPPIVNQLQQAFANALKAPHVAKFLRDLGMEAVGNTPSELAVEMVTITRELAETAKAIGLRPE